ncbi:hypothetical protein CVT24_005617 [Panaeolus cyanescens]|uniref:F-box domain-containing protein n=1 Tax=Panaeolus cyanescens TaxID=181874 RepID=A0A409YXZ8_9AGAR|nr:hypothetical protein CVT24_005617 [Panaeolus cyanescens]
MPKSKSLRAYLKSLRTMNRAKIVLPNELLYRIFDDLAAAYRYRHPGQPELFLANMRTCSLVAKSWVPLCRTYLFEKIQVDLYTSPTLDSVKNRRLATILNDHANLADCVRGITFEINHQIQPSDAVREELAKDHLSIFFQLSNVRTLDIRSKGKRVSYEPDGNAEKLGWHSCLDRHVGAENLTSLLLSDIDNVPILAILSSPYLTRLTISKCRLSDTVTLSLPSLYAKRPDYALEHLDAHHVKNLSLLVLGLCSHLRTMKLFIVYFALESNVDIQAPFIFPDLALLAITVADGWHNIPSQMLGTNPGDEPKLSDIALLKINGSFEDLPPFCAVQSLDFTVYQDDIESRLEDKWVQI